MYQWQQVPWLPGQCFHLAERSFTASPKFLHTSTFLRLTNSLVKQNQISNYRKVVNTGPSTFTLWSILQSKFTSMMPHYPLILHSLFPTNKTILLYNQNIAIKIVIIDTWLYLIFKSHSIVPIQNHGLHLVVTSL